jgi:hypothetical protein
MTKVAGLIAVMVLVGAMLSGCYPKACGDQGNMPQPIPYKGEKGEGMK